MTSPNELDPEEMDARWRDLTSQLGDLGTPLPQPRPPQSGPRDYEVEDDDGAFIPPEPEPHVFALRAVLGWFLLAVGIVGIVVIALVDGSGAMAVVCTLLAMGGLGVLVTGLPRRRDPDDDGAQV